MAKHESVYYNHPENNVNQLKQTDKIMDTNCALCLIMCNQMKWMNYVIKRIMSQRMDHIIK